MYTVNIINVLLQPQSVAAVLVCLATIVVIHKRRNTSSKLPLPPGPPGNWIFGNSLPPAFAYRKFEQWTQEYGPVFSLRQGRTTIIVIGRLEASIEIMEREGAALADRPINISAGETLSGGMRVLLTPAGERFKKMRRALHTHLQPKFVASYAPIMMSKARQHILDIIKEPLLHQDHAKHFAASVVMALAYGKTAVPRDDKGIYSVNKCLTRLGNNLRPGLWKVDVYPLLRYMPGYLNELQEGHAEELQLFKSQLNNVKIKLAQGAAVKCFGSYLLERQKELELSDDEIAYLAGSMFGAGSDTIASAISVCVLAAACYPEAQARVQKEIENVIGHERAPTLADCDMLPQLQSFVLETFRWRPVTAGGAPHKATRDIIWKEYCIPQGATVIGNPWSVGRDPDYFSEPEKFNPQRWILADGSVNHELKAFSFGFGRRVCPGQHMATNSVYINAALILWAFTVQKDLAYPIDEYAFTESANTHPQPFNVHFSPRAANSMEGVQDMMADYGE